MTLPRYREYKDSGIGWLGDVPRHWDVKRLRRVGEAFIGLTYNPDDVVDEGVGVLVLRSSNVQKGVITFDDNVYVNMDIPASLRTRVGDILLCSRNGSRALIGKNAAIDEQSEGVTFGAFMTVFRSEANAFLRYVFNSALFSYQSGAFLTSTINQLTVGSLYSFEVPLPPPPEQTAIAAFLDRETGKIDALVAEQEKLIALLKEKRQAVISHAVTKGLDPAAPMKDTGSTWLGDVPAHWDVRRLRHVSPEITVGIVVEPSKYYCDEGIPALRSLNVKPGAISQDSLVYISKDANELLAKSKLRVGDLVAVRSGQPGTAAVVPAELDGCNCIDLIIIRKPTNGCEQFLCWYVASDTARWQFAEGSGGAIQQHFNIGTAMNLVVPYPPRLEQSAVVTFLESETAKLDALIAEAGRGIDLLKERRTALISAAVTGKIDARGLVEMQEAA
jgi:type I restriction enzyme, S subunit